MLLSKLLQPKNLLFLICLVFISTRLYKIAEIPASVYWDEASIGYNAYSVMQTGKDEWGNIFPLHFRAFGEFKLPVYIYATALSVKLFDLNEFSIRIPAVLFSLGIIVLTYLLSKQLVHCSSIGLLSSFFMAVSPWFFIFSRTGYEVTAGLMFYLMAIYFFLKYDKNVWCIPLSIISFVLSAYSYNSFRIIAPITILTLIIFFGKDIKTVFKKAILPLGFSIVILFVSVIPIYRLYVYDAGISRLQTVSSTKSDIIKNYLSHFNLDFLFINGDRNLRSQQTGFGQLYFPQLILLPLGIIYFIKDKSKYKLLPIILLLIGPLPAAITKESPHALRSLSMVAFLSMISAGGVIFLGQLIKKRYIIRALAVVTFLSFFINYFINFISIYPIKSSKDWQYGYKEVFLNYKNDFQKYDQILISDEYAQPYIFALFYLKIDPNKFREIRINSSIDKWGFSTVESFDKFKFGKVDKLIDSLTDKGLIFASNKEKLDKKTIGEIRFLDKERAFWVYEELKH